jgi:hypothetical protein
MKSRRLMTSLSLSLSSKNVFRAGGLERGHQLSAWQGLLSWSSLREAGNGQSHNVKLIFVLIYSPVHGRYLISD